MYMICLFYTRLKFAAGRCFCKGEAVLGISIKIYILFVQPSCYSGSFSVYQNVPDVSFT